MEVYLKTKNLFVVYKPRQRDNSISHSIETAVLEGFSIFGKISTRHDIENLQNKIKTEEDLEGCMVISWKWMD